ncbi:hypothetical protein HpBT0202_12130 [Helicobacter pylori]
MDEKLESEIFEGQLNSLYKPIKQAPSAPESENKNNQGLANKEAPANQGLEQLASAHLKEANEPFIAETAPSFRLKSVCKIKALSA